MAPFATCRTQTSNSRRYTDAQVDTFDSDEDADDPIEDEHQGTFAWSGYVHARHPFQDLCSKSVSAVGQSWSQLNPNRVANCLTWV